LLSLTQALCHGFGRKNFKRAKLSGGCGAKSSLRPFLMHRTDNLKVAMFCASGTKRWRGGYSAYFTGFRVTRLVRHTQRHFFTPAARLYGGYF